VTISKDAVTPLPLKPLTPPIRAICQLLRASEELIIEAALTRSQRKAVESLAIHPMCPSLRQAQRAVEFMVNEVGLDLK
jgi:alpha-galactosidase/6-phospho-beta-glucosidase family protein